MYGIEAGGKLDTHDHGIACTGSRLVKSSTRMGWGAEDADGGTKGGRSMRPLIVD
jgi:hypothetical protein